MNISLTPPNHIPTDTASAPRPPTHGANVSNLPLQLINQPKSWTHFNSEGKNMKLYISMNSSHRLLQLFKSIRRLGSVFQTTQLNPISYWVHRSRGKLLLTGVAALSAEAGKTPGRYWANPLTYRLHLSSALPTGKDSQSTHFNHILDLVLTLRNWTF